MFNLLLLIYFSFLCHVFVLFVFVLCLVLNVPRVSRLTVVDSHCGSLSILFNNSYVHPKIIKICILDIIC